MAVVSFANLDEGFRVLNGLVTYTGGSSYSRGTTNYSWYSATGTNDVDFDGTGFTYNPASPYAATGGTVTAFRLDLGNDSENAPEVSITGLSFNLAQLAPLAGGSLTADQENDLIWRTLLAGNDTINYGNAAASSALYIQFAGDGRNVGAGQGIFGGNDTMTGDIGGGGALGGVASGDFFYLAQGSTVFGGNDTINVSGANNGSYIFGDAETVSGVLFGGNDVLGTAASGRSVYVIEGDADYVDGAVIGGNDVITLGETTAGYGDVTTCYGSLSGGNDVVNGGSGANFISGDGYTVSGGARGGADTLYGNGGADYLYGDFTYLYGTASGGNDALYGGAGDDYLYGDAAELASGASLNGGNDTLLGGDGADHIYGNGGDDSIRGDAGNDTIDGGDGFDTASWQYGTGATINVVTGAVLDGEGGTDTVSNVEQFIGSAYYRDVFTDAAGAQYFAGLGGNDYVLATGGGADVFNGGTGFDTVSFWSRTAATVNLAAGTALIAGETTTILAFEEVYGSNTGGDTLIGDNGNNTFWGFGGGDTLVGGKGLDTLNGGLGNDVFGFNASDLQAGVWDVIADFHEVNGTDRDILYFNGVPGSSLVVGQANGGVYVSTTALGGNGGVFIANFTAAQLSDQLMFT